MNRITVLTLLALPSFLAAQEPSHSAVFEWSKLTVVKTATGERRGVIDRATPTMKRFESHITTIEAGLAPHAAHRHPDEEVVIVKEGTLEVSINGKTETAGPGSTLFFASNDLHGMKNIGSGRATYHVIRIATANTPPATPPAKQ